MANYIATDTDLTAVANAIRTKGGTSASLAFPADFISAIGAIPTGGGGVVLETETIATVATQLSFKDFLNNNPLPLKYASGLIYLFFDSDTAPTQGTRTYGWCAFYYKNGDTKRWLLYNYDGSLKAPNLVSAAPSTRNNSYFGLSNNQINGTGASTEFYLPVGCKVIRGDVPLNIDAKEFDTTEVSA